MKKIYAADDDPTIAKLIQLSLSKLPDVQLTMFDNGLDLLREVQQSPPDAVITDIILPKLEGLAVTRLLKFDEQFSKIPVLVISSVIDPDITEQVKKVRADDYLKKPFRAQQIRDKVSSLLNIAI